MLRMLPVTALLTILACVACGMTLDAQSTRLVHEAERATHLEAESGSLWVIKATLRTLEAEFDADESTPAVAWMGRIVHGRNQAAPPLGQRQDDR